MVFLGPLTSAADWAGARLDDPDGIWAPAAFSSNFKVAVILVFYPWLGRFSQFIVRVSGSGRVDSRSSILYLLSSVLAASGTPPCTML